MKKLFFAVLTALTLAGLYTYFSQPTQKSDVPLIYWKSDTNPQRIEQIELFQKWLVKKGYVDKDGKPIAQLVLDAAGNQSSLIQAVSGVGGDAIDAYVANFQPLGVCADITEYGKELNFSEKDTYAGIWPMLCANGRQYAYPCNIGTSTWWGNRDTFAKYGMDAPPETWDIETFERIGTEFVKRANAGKARQDVYFVPAVTQTAIIPQMMARAEGVDMYNETLTAATMNNDAYIRAYEALRRWTDDLHLAPNAAEVASMSTAGGYGGVSLSQFISGKFAMILFGRYCLVRFREEPTPINFTNSQLALGPYKNVLIMARSAILYQGSKNKDLIKYFFEFLADKDYNDYIIRGADGLPPNPKFAENNPELYRPAKYPNEGNVHELEYKWTRDIGIIAPLSPYFRGTSFDTWVRYSMDKYFNNRAPSAAAALQEAEDRYNEGIEAAISADPHLKEAYLRDVELQKKIDEYKREKKKLPAHWIKNPFYQKYYRDMGMLEATK